jgi:protein subunit release factor A
MTELTIQKPQKKKKPKTVRYIYRRTPALDESVIRRYVQEQDAEQIIVELPDSMTAQDAQYLAAQALCDSYSFRKLVERAIEEMRTLESDKGELEEGIEVLLAKIAPFWEQEKLLEQP